MGLIFAAYDTEKLKKLIGFVRIFRNGERTKMFKERENAQNEQKTKRARERERASDPVRRNARSD